MVSFIREGPSAKKFGNIYIIYELYYLNYIDIYELYYLATQDTIVFCILSMKINRISIAILWHNPDGSLR